IANEYTHKRNIKRREIPASQIDAHIPFLHRINPKTRVDVRSDERMTYFEVLERFHHRLPFSSSKRRPDWLQELQENAKLHFVQAQRLLKVSRARRNRGEEESVTNVI